MKSAACIALAVAVLAYFAFAAPVMIRFFDYCSAVAKATRRERENADPQDGAAEGMNAFQFEQYRALMAGEQRSLQDPELIRRGEVLSSQMHWARDLAVVLVLLAIGVGLFA